MVILLIDNLIINIFGLICGLKVLTYFSQPIIFPIFSLPFVLFFMYPSVTLISIIVDAITYVVEGFDSGLKLCLIFHVGLIYPNTCVIGNILLLVQTGGILVFNFQIIPSIALNFFHNASVIFLHVSLIFFMTIVCVGTFGLGLHIGSILYVVWVSLTVIFVVVSIFIFFY